MKEKMISVLMLTLILTSMLGMAFVVRPSLAQSSGNGVLGKGGFDTEQSLTASKENGAFTTRQNVEQGNNPVNSSQTSSYNGWNFSDTSQWGNFTYRDGNKTRLIVGVDGAKSLGLVELERIVAKYQARIVNTVSIGGRVSAAVVELLLASVTTFVGDVHVAGLATYIEPNMKVQAQFVPNDPYWNYQWGPRKIEADWAWNTTVGNHSVLVAVVDTGIDYNHPDLKANYVALGYDWVNNDTDPLDDFGHGTHCAGIIAAVLNNNVGIAGIANVSIMAEKVIDAFGFGYWDWVASGIVHATDMGADIISMSLGGYGESELVHDAVKYAYKHGVLLVAAAGNDNTNTKSYPAAYDEVVAVAATDQYDNTAYFSNWGDWIELAAPGVDIYSTMPTYHVTMNDHGYAMNYAYMSGTSMACPHVSGEAALLWSLYPNKTRDWVRLWLRYTADDLGDPGFDVHYGYGRINARTAVEQTPPADDLIAYEWATPPYVEPSTSGIVNASVLNFGENDETSVEVQLFANDTAVDSTLIDFLASGNSTTVSLTWNPTQEGLYNVTFYVVPVFGEANLENNVLYKYIYVGFPVKAVVLHSAGNVLGSIITNWQVLMNDWYLFGDKMVYIDYTTLNKESITYEDIATTGADVLIVSCAYDPYAGWQFTDSEIEAIERYVYEGHGLIATAGTFYSYVPNNNKLAPLFGINETTMWGARWTDLLHLLNTTHPIFAKVPNPLIIPQVGTALPSDGRWDSDELIGGKYLALGHYQESAIVAYRGLVYISPWLEVIPPYYHHHLQLLYNALTWSRYVKPQHELGVSLEAPQAIKPGKSTLLNATVQNMGLSNETMVKLQLLVNGAVVDSTTIPDLCAGESYTLSNFWTPTMEGIYNVTAYVLPVLGEDNIINNVKSSMVLVSLLSTALFQNWDPWDYAANQIALDKYGVPYVVFSSSDFGTVDLSGFAKVVIASDQDQTFYDAIHTYRWWFESYASNGGVLEIHAADLGWHGGHWTGSLPGGLQWASYYGQYVRVVDPTHPLLKTPNVITETELDNWNYAVHGYFSVYPADVHIVIIEDSSRMPAYLEFRYGAGSIMASSQPLEWAYKQQLSLILENSLLYTPTKYEHDMAVTLDAPPFWEPGTPVLLNATVRNRGWNNETCVALQLLINGTAVNSTVVDQLLVGEAYTLSYLWAPTVQGLYNVTAYAPPVLGEEFTVNNIATQMVRVRFPPRILVVDTPWPEDTGALTKLGYEYTLVSPAEFATIGLYRFNVLFVGWNPGDALVDALVARAAEIAEWVAVGNGIVALSEFGEVNRWGWLPLFVNSSWGFSGETVHVLNDTHPVMYDLSDADLSRWWNSYHGYFINYSSDWQALAEGVEAGYPITLAATYGDGRIVVTHQDPDYHFYYNNVPGAEKLLRNMIEWANCPPREHDLDVALDALTRLRFGDSLLLNATVRNFGSNNETNVELQLLINGTVVDSIVIPHLLTGSSYAFNYLWTPTIEGTYNVTAYAPPVPAEEFTANNVVEKLVKVRLMKGCILLDQTHGTDSIVCYSLWLANLTERGYVIETRISGPITSNVLRPYEIFVIPQARSDYTQDELSAIQDFVLDGGGLLVIGDDSPWIYTSLTSPAGMTWVGGGVGGYTSDITPHPVTDRITTAYFGAPVSCLQVASPATDLIRDQYGYIMLAASEIGQGKVLGIADEQSIDDSDIGYANNLLLANDMIDWMSLLYDHNVAIASVVTSAYKVLRGDNVDIAVVAENSGNFTENVTVDVYYEKADPHPSFTAFMADVPNEPHPANATWIEPSFTDLTGYSVGERFKVTVWLNLTVPSFLWQIRLIYNRANLNATGCGYTAGLTSQFFEGLPTFPVSPVFGSINATHAYVMIGESLLAANERNPGYGSLCWIEFQIVNKPPASYRDHLELDPSGTYACDPNIEEIPMTEYGSVYSFETAPPIGEQTVCLLPGSNKTLTFLWNTSNVTPGDYVIRAKAGRVPGEIDTSDNIGSIAGVIKITKPLVASFTYSPSFPKPSETITFNASSSTPDGGVIVSYRWDFGDGNITATTDPIIAHAYVLSGLYNVTLTVTDNESLTDSTWKTISVFTRDIAVTNVTPSTDQIYVGRAISINVTVLNKGEVTEMFDVILYYNITAGDIVGTQTVLNLLPGEQRTLTFVWNTTEVKVCYNYQITAYAMPVVGETDVADNTVSSSTLVKVKLLGDINGDGKVDMKDIGAVAKAFGSYGPDYLYPGSPPTERWNPDADVNFDGKIDMKDVAITAKGFGQRP